MNSKIITAKPLTQDRFKLYGQVIESIGTHRIINQGLSKKWDYLAELDMNENGAKVNLGILRTAGASTMINRMERHHLSSQVFIPLEGKRSLVVVAPPSDHCPDLNEVEAFILEGNQGVSFNRMTWHHTLLPLEGEMEFVTMMRDSKKPDVEFVLLTAMIQISLEELHS